MISGKFVCSYTSNCYSVNFSYCFHYHWHIVRRTIGLGLGLGLGSQKSKRAVNQELNVGHNLLH